MNNLQHLTLEYIKSTKSRFIKPRALLILVDKENSGMYGFKYLKSTIPSMSKYHDPVLSLYFNLPCYYMTTANKIDNTNRYYCEYKGLQNKNKGRY